MTKDQTSSHRKALERIAAQPNKYEIKNVIASAIEPALYSPDRQTIAEPDIVFFTSDMDVYIIEYKSNGNDRLITKAEKQLSTAADWFNKYANISPKVKIIHGSEHPELKN